MKQLLAAVFACLLVLTGCYKRSVTLLNPVEFFYPCAEYQYGVEDAVFASESREAAGYADNLEYLLKLYFKGPLDASLVRLFPEDTQVARMEWEENTLVLELSNVTRGMSDLHYSIACTCLSLTCMGIAPADAVRVESGARTLTTERDKILTLDDYMQR